MSKKDNAKISSIEFNAELAPAPEPIAAPADSFLTNPAPEGPAVDDLIDDTDKRFMERIKDNARRALVLRARALLKEDGALIAFDDEGGSLTLERDQSLVHKAEGLEYTGKLTINYSPRNEQLVEYHLIKYLQALRAFEGSPSDLVSQIAQDLYITLRPHSLKVSFVLTIHGAKIKAGREHKRPKED